MEAGGRGQELMFFVACHTHSQLCSEHFILLAVCALYPRSTLEPSSGGGSVLRSPEIRAQWGLGSQWGKIGALSVLGNMLFRGNSNPEDNRRAE